MSTSSNSTAADSVHQANLATFKSYRRTIDELNNKPYTLLGDHVSLVRRLQDWRKAVAHLTVWVADDRAYYQQARAEIVNLLEATFDSVRTVDQIRNARGESNWIKASDREFEALLIDYIKLIEVAFPPHRQARYNTQADQDALNRGRVLYNGLYSFRRRLEEVRAPQRRTSLPLQQGAAPQAISPTTSTPVIGQPVRPVSRINTQNNTRSTLPQGARVPNPTPVHQPYSQTEGSPQTLSLPANSLAPTSVGYSQIQPPGSAVVELPHTESSTVPPTWTQGTPVFRSSPDTFISSAAPVTPRISGSEASAPTTMVLPAEEQDSFDLDWDELEALDRSEWEPTTAGNDDLTNPDGRDGVTTEGTTGDSLPVLAQPPIGQMLGLTLTPVPQDATLAQKGQEPLATGPNELSGNTLATQVSATPPVIPKVESEYSDAQLLRSSPLTEGLEKNPQALERRKSLLAAEVIDIDDLSDDEEVAERPESLSTRGPPPSSGIPSSLADDVINIDSDDEMEVDELEPSVPPESARQSATAEEKQSREPSSRGSPPKDKLPQQSTVASTQLASSPTQQLINDVNSLPSGVRAQIRQRAKEPMILHYLSIEPSMTRDAAEEKFQRMSDQTVFSIYVQTKSARRIIDHFKNVLAQSGHKLLLPHIDVRETPSEPPTLLCTLAGSARLATGTVEFTISADTMASLERWKTRFITPAGSHGELVAVELACYSSDAFYSLEADKRLELTPNAQARTWPDGGILWAFVNSRAKEKDHEVRLFLSPPPFVEPTQPVDISDFIREGQNTVKFVHLGGMEHFIFAVQTRIMPPPHTTWPGVLKRVQSLDPLNSGYQGLINRLTTMLEEQ